ncbi:MAG: exonuclease SbcCD subunit D [Actinomycetota bacterium]|nr:exonuclease SbcCD subunit D [Actinomycetota bacterium]
MRFIQTGDWHLGRLFHNQHLTADQRFTLDALQRLAEERRVDAVVIAGDVYDRAVPPTEAVELLNDVLGHMALELRIPVVMIAGNHDSPVRLQYLNGLVSRVGVHVVGAVGARPQGVEIVGADGVRVVFWPLAYTDPETARCDLSREDIHTHEAAICAHIAMIREQMPHDSRNVVVGHAFVTGAAPSESERPLTVGGTGEISCDVFEGFDYVALGHLHRPQAVTDRVRYAGSLLKYSFDEADHRKSVTIVDMDSDGGVVCEEVALPARHELIRLIGSFDELMAGPVDPLHKDAYVEVKLTDSESALDPMQRLRTLYPNILSLTRETIDGGPSTGPVCLPKARKTDELFAEFFEDVTGRALGAERELQLEAVLGELERERREVAS